MYVSNISLSIGVALRAYTAPIHATTLPRKSRYYDTTPLGILSSRHPTSSDSIVLPVTCDAITSDAMLR